MFERICEDTNGKFYVKKGLLFPMYYDSKRYYINWWNCFIFREEFESEKYAERAITEYHSKQRFVNPKHKRTVKWL